MRKTPLQWSAAILLTILLAAPARAAPRCQNSRHFERRPTGSKKNALAQGTPPKILAEAAPDLTFDPAIIRRDQGQAVFNLTFLQFSDRLISKDRMVNGEAA